MGKKVEPPPEELAPAYFMQFSALWCIMLGFFVMLLSLGNTQKGPGQHGVGQVRDAFGSTGGLGLLPYAKNALFGRNDGGASSLRIRQSVPSQAVKMDGYIRGMLWKKGLSSVAMINVIQSKNTTKVVLLIPVSFQGNKHLEMKSVKLLEMLSEVFVTLHQYNLEVTAVCENDEDPIERQRTAMFQAAVVARFLTEAAMLNPDRVETVGYSDSRFIEGHDIEHVKGYVLVSLEQENQ